jgi:uncharacterized protein YjeT (DUF2065 family)
MIRLDIQTSPKSYIQTVTKPIYSVVASSSKGKSQAYARVEEQINYQERNDTQLRYVLDGISEIAVFERRAERLRDLLLEDRTALSETEILQLKRIFNNSRELISANEEQGQLILLSLASLLEPLIENSAYSQEIASIVRTLLKSPIKTLRYAGLDVIAAGLGIVPIADKLLKEAKLLLQNEGSGYVLDYLESL